MDNSIKNGYKWVLRLHLCCVLHVLQIHLRELSLTKTLFNYLISKNPLLVTDDAGDDAQVQGFAYTKTEEESVLTQGIIFIIQVYTEKLTCG